MKASRISLGLVVLFSLAACGGGGGDTTAQSAPKVVPLKVFKTSYENKNAIPFDGTQVPTVRALGIPKVYPDEQDSNDRSITFADFFQEGKYSAFVMSNRAANVYGVPNINDTPGVAYFLSQDANGHWIDRTSELLKTSADRAVCVSGSYSLVADFNNDGKPDVFVSCTGVDYDLGLTDLAQEQQAYLSDQVLYLSQPDGTYKRVDVPYHIYGHMAAAGDINGDGNIDIITTDQAVGGERMPFVLIGHGDGTFTRNDTIVPSNIFDYTGQNQGLYQVYLIPIANRLDVVFSSGGNTVWMKSNGAGGFDPSTAVTFVMPNSAAYGVQYGMPLDAIFDNSRNSFYFHTNAAYSTGTEWAVIKYDTTGTVLGVSELWNNPTATLQPYSAQFKPTDDGYLVGYTGGCSIPLGGECLMKVKR